MYVGYRDKYRIVSNCWFDLRGGGRWSQTLLFFSDMLPSCMQGGWWDTVDDKRKFEIKYAYSYGDFLGIFKGEEGRSFVWKTTMNVWGT